MATTPSLRKESGAAPASNRPSVTAEPAMRIAAAAWPTRSSGSAHASASSGAANTASPGSAPRIAQPRASAQPTGTSTNATHVSTSAAGEATAMPATTAAIETGRVSAHAGVRKRSSHAGSPAPGSATHADWAMVRTKLSSENHTRGPGPPDLAPQRADQLAGPRRETVDQLSDLGEPGPQRRIARLDREHRVLERGD